jgi:hypothetical protein
VRRGDAIFPVRVENKGLYLLGRITVSDVSEDGVTEVVRGVLGSRVQRDLRVPREVLDRWRFANGRPIKFLVDGEIRRANSFQGVYRLSAQTATDLFGLVFEHEALALRQQ